MNDLGNIAKYPTATDRHVRPPDIDFIFTQPSHLVIRNTAMQSFWDEVRTYGCGLLILWSPPPGDKETVRQDACALRKIKINTEDRRNGSQTASRGCMGHPEPTPRLPHAQE